MLCSTCFHKLPKVDPNTHEKQRVKRIMDRELLTDAHVRKVLISSGIDFKQITPEMIDMKRYSLFFKRASMRIKSILKEKSNGS
jgi:hypothetical protein